MLVLVNRFCLLLLFSLFFLVCLPFVSGLEVVVDKYDVGAYSDTQTAITVVHPSSTTGRSAYSQSFRPLYDGANLTNVQVYASQSGASGVCTAYIEGHSGTWSSSGVPNGTIYATSTGVTVTAWSGALAIVNFTFPDGYVFDASQIYTLVLEGTSGDVSNLYFGFDSSAPYLASGNMASYYSSAWNPIVTADLVYIIYGEGGDVVSFNTGNNVYITEVTEDHSANFNNTAVSATGGVNVESISNNFNNTGVSASGELSIADATLTINETPTLLIVVIFAIINIVLVVFPRIPILNIVFALMTIGLVATSFATTFKDLPFHPYLAILEVLLAVLSLLACALRLRDT